MVKHLGRLKIVTRRKTGDCRYANCALGPLVPGQRVFLLTKMGNIKGRTTIFYKAFHPACFNEWCLWMIEQTPASTDGRKKMGLTLEVKAERAKLVRERARILRAIRNESSGTKLDNRIERLGEVDRLITDTGYPVIPYRGRRTTALIGFEKFVKTVKDKYGSERKVPRSVWDEVRKVGMEPEFKAEMDEWHKETVEASQKTDAESVQEDANV